MSNLGFLEFLQIFSAGVAGVFSVLTSLATLKDENGRWKKAAFYLLFILGISLATSFVTTIMSAYERQLDKEKSETNRLSDSLVNQRNYIDLANRSEEALIRTNDAVYGIKESAKEIQQLQNRTRATLDSVERQLFLQREAYKKTIEVLQSSSEVNQNVDKTLKGVRGLGAPIARWEFELIFRVYKASKMYQTISKWAFDMRKSISEGDSALNGVYYKGYPARNGNEIEAITFKNATSNSEKGLPIYTGFVGFRMTLMDSVQFKNDSMSLGGGMLTIYSNNSSAFNQDGARIPATIVSFNFTTGEMLIRMAIVKYYLDFPKVQPAVSVADLEENVMLFEVYSSEDCAIAPIQGFLYSNNHKEKFTIGILPVRVNDTCNRIFYKPYTMIVYKVSDDYDRLFNSFLE